MESVWLNKMIARGDSVAIDNGRLVVHDAYHYQSYSTGRYSGARISGLTLQFENTLTGEPAYCCFNTELTYQRSGKHGKQGEPLPDKQFYVKSRTQFYKLWEACQLPKPQSNSRYYEVMGKLKGIVFTGEVTKGERLNTGNLKPLSISSELIDSTINKRYPPHKKHIRNTQAPHKEHTSPPHKDIAQGHKPRDIQPVLSTGENKYGNTAIREHGYTGNVISIPNTVLPDNQIDPQKQPNNEWLADYSKE